MTVLAFGEFLNELFQVVKGAIPEKVVLYLFFFRGTFFFWLFRFCG